MRPLLIILVPALFLIPKALPAQVLELKQGDHICLVGNALGERMQHHNAWETRLYAKFPEKDLVVRNLCFPGDEPFERIRSQNFGDPDSHLAHSKANVVLYFFGFNESFAGEKGRDKFRDEIVKLVEHTKQQKYNGKDNPRVVLISPIAFENTGNPDLPTGETQNKNLELYTAALKDAAAKTKAGFVDLFHPTKSLFEKSEKQLTLNGSHLNAAGYQALAPLLMQGLFAAEETKIDLKLKQAVADKNFHWWHRYRAVNGYSIYGARGQAGSDGTYNNADVMERERAILDQMTANRDRRIWAIARGEKVPEKIDDGNTLPFITPKTNVGGKNDKNRKAGKLGSLEYLNAEKQQKLFKLAEGYEINLFASEEQFPELANPVALNFDNKGRLWVSTMASYPHWKPKTPLNDKVLIFEDHDRDGRADECKIFAEGLHQPTGFEIGRGGAYVAQQPDVLFLKDTDGDDRADVRERRLVGFDTADSHHGLSAFEWGPGGGLYFQEGTFKYSQVESPYGLTRLHEAGLWRYDPKTEKFGVHVNFAFANPWGHVFDRWGQDFIADASPGYSYWAAPITGKMDYPNKHVGGAQGDRVNKFKKKEYKGRLAYPTFYEKRTRPSAGCEIVSSRHFPEEDQGDFLLTNVIGDRAVLRLSMHDDGSGFTAKEKPPLVFCEDGNFRPVDVQFGPDGALYIVDWHNALIGHLQHNLRDPNRDHSHGRIWRVTYPSRPLVTPAKIAGEPIPALLELLKIPEDRTRYRARRELAERDSDQVMAAVKKWTASLSPGEENYEHNLLEALWVCQTHNRVNRELLDRVLKAKDFHARAAGVRVLSFWLDQIDNPLAMLKTLINDKAARVRLEAVRALSFLSGDSAVETALEVLNHDTDKWLDYTLEETMRQLETR